MPISADSIEYVVGILGIISSLGIFVSHIPTYCDKIHKKKAWDHMIPVTKDMETPWIVIRNTHQVSLLRYALWILYGLPFVTQGNHLFAISNAIGFAIELIYMIIYVVYANNKQRFYVYIVLACEILAYAGFVLGLRVADLPHYTLLPIVASVCFLLDMSISLVSNMLHLEEDLENVNTQNLDKYALSWPVLANIHNSMIWMIFALVSNTRSPNKHADFDFTILFSNFCRCIAYPSVMLRIWSCKSATKGSTSYYQTSSAGSSSDAKVEVANEKQILSESLLQPDTNNV